MTSFWAKFHLAFLHVLIACSACILWPCISDAAPEAHFISRLNGGPGCSSVGGGAFTEIGPFRPHLGGRRLALNPYSWNKGALLYSPSGVGFSYSKTNDTYGKPDDTKTARQNLAFLLAWLQKYPEYQVSDLFLTGESYAGHYIPQLSDLIMNYNRNPIHNFSLNLRAIAIGNPLLNYGLDTNATYSFLWSRGVISDETYEGIKTLCEFSHGYPANEDSLDMMGRYLTYATVRGASHMVPYSNPRQALVLFDAFVRGAQLPSQ
ncbi:hypothetical protein KP509_17G004300 [Ceratopteris richardii]|uniref:Carboxypeptidase n=1 Tax=Ceratopteris richardii TaxID=49495 RepID=A0A8T2SRN7_CERRI|nr:hypothetical protein KP509_17G004300 [Ceratopteris richardii]